MIEFTGEIERMLSCLIRKLVLQEGKREIREAEGRSGEYEMSVPTRMNIVVNVFIFTSVFLLELNHENTHCGR